MATQNVWTYTLKANTLTIDDTFGLTAISILCTDGSIKILGKETAGSVSSSNITLKSGQSVTIGTLSSLNSLLISIDANGGTCNLIGIK